VSSPSIKVENLSKSYIISHEGQERYTALRDVVARNAKKIFSFNYKLSKQKDYNSKEEFYALNDISFEINQGDRVGIIGRNGAGKSTLLKVLSRITEPTTGKISIKGRVASLLEVGTGFHPELTGRENIYLNGAILGMSRVEIKKKFDEIVDFSEVKRFLDTPVKRYSSGMYVRLAFAVAAHLEPEILIVDEVLAVGDAQFQKKCLGKMEDVSKKEGRTILFVSHNMATILNLCEQCIYLNNGQINKVGKSSNVISSYLTNNGSQSTELNLSPFQSILKKASPFFILTRFYLSSTISDNCDIIEADSNVELNIIIEGEVEEIDSRFNLGYTLINEKGDVILMSFSSDQPEEKWPKFQIGKNRFRTLIDTSILNEGKYFVYLLASLHCVKALLSPEDNICVGFEVVGNRGHSPYWINRRNTVLAPFIPWQVA
jgi:lipopolysaccharide transport system ATP-binding protein